MDPARTQPVRPDRLSRGGPGACADADARHRRQLEDLGGAISGLRRQPSGDRLGTRPASAAPTRRRSRPPTAGPTKRWACWTGLASKRLSCSAIPWAGFIAPRVASRYPGRIEKLVLSGTRAGFVGAFGWEERLREFDTLTPEERGRTRAVGMAAPGAPPDVLARLAGIAGEGTREAFAGGVAVLNGTDNRAILPTPQRPGARALRHGGRHRAA